MKRILFAILLLSCLASTVNSRQFKIWGYSELAEKSVVIAIATPIATRPTGTVVSKLRNESGEDEGYLSDTKFEEVVTTFEAVTILKGTQSITTINLRHFGMHKDSPLVHGPHFVSFRPDEKDRYLLFLMAAPNGQFDPVAGQVDPGISIIRLDDRDQLHADIKRPSKVAEPDGGSNLRPAGARGSP